MTDPMAGAKWIRSAGSKWHKGFIRPWLNKWNRNPDFKRPGPGEPFAMHDPDNPYYLPVTEERAISVCGTLNIKPENGKIADDLPRQKNGKLKRTRICGNCIVHVEDFNA